jgi:catechol 2,3-dioxygenase-like lactoylglutathione lyase family enzyme
VTPEGLRARGERFHQELGRESYVTGAGLAAEAHFEEIFERYADVAGDEAAEAARAIPALYAWVVDNRVGRAVAPLEDRLHAWEAGARVALPDGTSLPYQRVTVEIANAAERGRRLALDAARRAVLAEPTALRAERLGRERDLLLGLGLGDAVAARTALAGIDLDALGAACEDFLSRTADLYRDTLGERLRRRLGLRPGEAERADAAFLFRGAEFDDAFPAESLVPTARRQVGEMGLEAEAGGRIRYDTEERERKRPRAFCAPVRVPEEVYLVIRPFGGASDFASFWHELGHALHFSHADASLPFEHRWLGDNSVTEGFAMLFEHQVAAPTWLRRYGTLRGERLAAFVRDQAFAKLAVVRRYAAKLRYEIALFRAPRLEAGAASYVETLTAATLFRYAREDYLLDLDEGFYAARYLRAWQIEAGLAAHLTERFDEDWFRNPRAGPFVAALMARGQRDDAAALAAEVLGRPLDFGPLAASCEAGLA